MPEYFQILKPLQIDNRLLLGRLTVTIFSFCCFYHVLTGRHFIIISCWLSKTLSIFQIFFFCFRRGCVRFYRLIYVTFIAIFFLLR